MRVPLVYLLPCVLQFTLAPCLAVEHGTGWLGDGSAVYPAQALPTAWNANTGEHILWKAPLPNWSNSSPIVVGGRVYVLSEPLDYSPILTCLDADTGKTLWERELDAVTTMPADQQDEARAFAREAWRWKGDTMVLAQEMYEYHTAHRTDFDGLTPKEAAKPDWDAFLARAKALGCGFSQFVNGAGGWQAKLDVPKGSAAEKRVARLRELGLAWDLVWYGFGTWVGVAFPTPCSDGTHVYTVTGHYLYSCHDLEGNLVWQRRIVEPARRGDKRAQQALTPEQRERMARINPAWEQGWPAGWPAAGTLSTSPAMADGFIVYEVGSWTRAIRAATGETAWEHPMPIDIDQNMANPRITEVNGVAVVVTATTGEIIRLRDGRILGRLPGSVAGKSFATGPAVYGDVVLNTIPLDKMGRDREYVATRLSLQGDTLVMTELWRKPSKLLDGFNLWRTIGRDGWFYHDTMAVKAEDGTVRNGGRANLTLPLGAERLRLSVGGHTDAIFVGDLLVMKQYETGVIGIVDPVTRKVLGGGILPKNPPEVRDERKIRTNARSGQWPWLGAGALTAARNRLYVRAFDYLWCIGDE